MFICVLGQTEVHPSSLWPILCQLQRLEVEAVFPSWGNWELCTTPLLKRKKALKRTCPLGQSRTELGGWRGMKNGLQHPPTLSAVRAGWHLETFYVWALSLGCLCIIPGFKPIGGFSGLREPTPPRCNSGTATELSGWVRRGPLWLPLQLVLSLCLTDIPLYFNSVHFFFFSLFFSPPRNVKILACHRSCTSGSSLVYMWTQCKFT